MSIIAHSAHGILIGQRQKDGYINLTAMAKVSGKKLNNYLRMKSTKAFIDELSTVTRIRVDLLTQTIASGPNEHRGTWGHPQVAIHCAQWCSPQFAVLVSQWVMEWMSTGHNPIAPPAEPPELEVIMPTEAELEYLRSRQWEKDELAAIDAGETPDYEAIKREFNDKSGGSRAQAALEAYRQEMAAWLKSQKKLPGAKNPERRELNSLDGGWRKYGAEFVRRMFEPRAKKKE